MHGVFGELKKKLAMKFSSFNNTTKLSSRQDHGDIDIVVVPPSGQSTKDVVLNLIGSNIVKNTNTTAVVTSNGQIYQPNQMYVTTNGNIFSILYRPNKLDKNVHIDFISAKDEEDARNKQDYLAYNDFIKWPEVQDIQTPQLLSSWVDSVGSTGKKCDFSTFLKIFQNLKLKNNKWYSNEGKLKMTALVGEFSNLVDWDATLNDELNFATRPASIKVTMAGGGQTFTMNVFEVQHSSSFPAQRVQSHLLIHPYHFLSHL
jgi:hypothetical protein